MDIQTQVILAIVGVLLVVYLFDTYWARFKNYRKFTLAYEKEMNDVLTKDEYKVKGRYE